MRTASTSAGNEDAPDIVIGSFVIHTYRSTSKRGYQTLEARIPTGRGVPPVRLTASTLPRLEKKVREKLQTLMPTAEPGNSSTIQNDLITKAVLKTSAQHNINPHVLVEIMDDALDRAKAHGVAFTTVYQTGLAALTKFKPVQSSKAIDAVLARIGQTVMNPGQRVAEETRVISPKYYNSLCATGHRLTSYLGNRYLHLITLDDLEMWRDKHLVLEHSTTHKRRGDKLASCTMEVECTRAVYLLRQCRKTFGPRDWTAPDELMLPTGVPAPNDLWEPHEIIAIIDGLLAKHPPFGLAFALLCLSGLRAVELHFVRWWQLRLDHRHDDGSPAPYLHLEWDETKTFRNRNAPLFERLHDILINCKGTSTPDDYVCSLSQRDIHVRLPNMIRNLGFRYIRNGHRHNYTACVNGLYGPLRAAKWSGHTVQVQEESYARRTHEPTIASLILRGDKPRFWVPPTERQVRVSGLDDIDGLSPRLPRIQTATATEGAAQEPEQPKMP